MNKAREYWKEVLRYSSTKEHTLIKVKTMNHKTLEDVKELAEKKQEVMRLKGRGLYKVVELENLFEILEKLKL